MGVKPLSGLDAAFLHLETPETPMNVGSLHLLRVPARDRAGFLERVRRHVEGRLHLVPVFTRRIASLPFDIASPVWIEDREVDLEWHIRRVRLPRPGTMAQLESLVAKLHAELLDRERPLWRFHLIEGLEGGEVAWYAKVHHATLDGAAGVKLAEALLDATPKGRRIAPPAKRALEETPGMADLLGAAIAKSVGEYGKFLRAIPEAARLVDGSLSALGSLVSTPKGGRRGLPIGPPTPFNVSIGSARSFATASIPLEEVKKVARRHDAKVNDVVLTLVSGAVRSWLAARRALPDAPLVAAMPVSLRGEGDSIYTTRATMVLANLATNLDDPLARLHAIRASAGRAKEITIRAKSVIPMDLPAIGAPWVISGIARAYGYAQAVKAFPPLANLVVSNVPGPRAPLHLAGARVRSWWPVSIVEHGLGLNVTVESYCGSLDFGIVAAREAMADARRLAAALYDAHEELKTTRA